MEEKRTSKSQTKDDCQEESFLFVNSTFCVHFFSPRCASWVAAFFLPRVGGKSWCDRMLKGRVEIPWKLFSLWERLAALHPLPARHFPASSAQTAGKAEWECVENVENSRPTTKDFPLGLRDESIVRQCARWSRVGKFSREKILHILLSTRSISGMFRCFSVFCAVWQRKCAEENFRAIKKHQENLKKKNHLPKGKLVTNLLTLLSYQNNCRGRSRTDWVIDKPSATASVKKHGEKWQIT